MKREIEIKAAEGGDDSKLLVEDLHNMFIKAFDRMGWNHESKMQDGRIVTVVEGDRTDVLDGEAGGHRFQRVPPTEKRGRVHTSTVIVSVLGSVHRDPRYSLRDPEHFRVEWFSGSGAGGQHRNKHQNSCRVYHLPTGLMETRQGRKRESNLKDAREALIRKLDELSSDHIRATTSETKRTQVGSGMRGDKIRTYRMQDGVVTDHRSGRKTQMKKISSGDFSDLWSISEKFFRSGKTREKR